MSTIERAIAIAAKAHEGQQDKAGAPYVFHPLRMMLRLTDEDERIVAVLHDTVEDTQVTLDYLREQGFSSAVLSAIESVTKREEESYDEFVQRAGANPIGRKVKLADLVDNCDLNRIASPTDRDYARIEKYKKAIAVLEALDGHARIV